MTLPSGTLINNWKILSGPYIRYQKGIKRTYYLCECLLCGSQIKVINHSLLSDGSKNCLACSNTKRNITHADSKSRLYRIWAGMNNRCAREDQKYSWYYSLKGIRVCQAWRNSYETFRTWAMANGYSDTMSIHRIDNDKNYTPANCIWLPLQEHRNKEVKGCKLVTGSQHTSDDGIPLCPQFISVRCYE